MAMNNARERYKKGHRSGSSRSPFLSGQLYSLIAVLIAIPIMLFIAFFISSAQDIRFEVSERIVADQAHQVVESIESDLSRALAISGRRALLAAVNEVVGSGETMPDARAGLEELMLNGTLYGNESFLVTDNTLDDWQDAVLDVQTVFSIQARHYGLNIGDQSGFALGTGSGLDVNVSDVLGLVRIDRSTHQESNVSVAGLEDPIYSLNTQGFIKRMVIAYPYPYYARKVVTGTAQGSCSGNVSFEPGSPDPEKILVTYNASGISGFRGVVGETPDTPSVSCYLVSAANAIDLVNSSGLESGYWPVYLDGPTSAAWSLPLLEGVEEGYYYPGAGPGLLMRLEGNMTSVPEGMESFVRIPDLQAQGIPTKPYQTLVDYLYFSEQILNGTGVRGFPGWFRIDPGHAAVYSLTELLEG